MKPEDIASVIATIAGTAANGRDVMAQLQNWIGSVAGNAALKWPPRIRSDQACSMRGCRSVSTVVCDACGRSFCLSHARVGVLADAVCEECVASLIPEGRRRPGPDNAWQTFVDGVRQQGERMAGGARQGPRTRRQADPLRAHYAALQLQPSASWDTVVKRFRELSRQHHPDRAPAGRRREAEARYKRITEAYAAIRAARGA